MAAAITPRRHSADKLELRTLSHELQICPLLPPCMPGAELDVSAMTNLCQVVDFDYDALQTPG
jgi:hypothetical protein